MKKITIQSRIGKIKGVVWGQGNKKKVLALHGWLDNAFSFYALGPILAKQGCEVVALDFPGHGKSHHKADGHFLHVFDYLLDIQDVLKSLEWEKTIFLGHSMGAAISHMFAASFPEKVEKIIMIENMGAVPPYKKGTGVESLREALSQWENYKPKRKRYYESVEQGLKARIKATPMKEEFLLPMVKRGLKKTSKGFHWRTDKRLKIRSLFRLSEEAIQEFLSQTNSPSLLILAKPTSYALEYPMFAQRLKALNPDETVYIKGHHHLHMDQAETVSKSIIKFLETK